MSILDEQLIRAINAGNCFAVVGSGPSCEAGLPSWEIIARNILEKIQSLKSFDSIFIDNIKNLIDSYEYPKAFSAMEKKMNPADFYEIVKQEFKIHLKHSFLYEYLLLQFR